MKVYIAGNYRNGKMYEFHNSGIDISNTYILESFYYMNDTIESMIPKVKSCMIDSGAFTFMQNAHTTNVDWEGYIQKYGDFIVKNKIDLFFELDIDSVVGLEKVNEYRKLLEDITNKQPIPVWHRNRGKEGYFKLLEEYPYVALGGVVIRELAQNEYKYFPYFIDEAHKRGVKIHGLGFTRINDLKKYHFDSVDSTAWVAGNRFGFIYKFNGRTFDKYQVPKGYRLKDSRLVACINFTEWIKFQKYAERYL